MIKKIMLIRHAKPDFPGGVRLCLGRRTEIGIGEEGRAQASELKRFLERRGAIPGKIFSSPLKRAAETAQVLSGGTAPVIICEDITEIDMGEWDGLDFGTIRGQYSELYQRRNDDLSIPPAGGEPFPDASRRMKKALSSLALAGEDEVIAAVSHSAVIRALLCDIIGIPYKDNRTIPVGYVSVTSLLYDTEKDHFEYLEAEYEGYVHQA